MWRYLRLTLIGFVAALACWGGIFLTLWLQGKTVRFQDREQKYSAQYDINDPVCHTSDGRLIVWINSDNWIEVQGTDQEEIAELVAKRIGRKDKP